MGLCLYIFYFAVLGNNVTQERHCYSKSSDFLTQLLCILTQQLWKKQYCTFEWSCSEQCFSTAGPHKFLKGLNFCCKFKFQDTVGIWILGINKLSKNIAGPKLWKYQPVWKSKMLKPMVLGVFFNVKTYSCASWPYGWSRSFFLLCFAKGVFFTHSLWSWSLCPPSFWYFCLERDLSLGP